MKQDRFLIGILVGVAVLVVVAVGVFFLRQNDQTYIAEDTPDGVVHNYVLAIQLGDYDRAYGYLAEGEGKPDSSSRAPLFWSRSAGHDSFTRPRPDESRMLSPQQSSKG